MGFKAAIAAAAQFLDNLITNPITVNILVGWGEDDNGAYSIGNNLSLGGALKWINLNYSQLRSDLIASASTAADRFAVTSLPMSDPTNGESFFVSYAEAKALKLLPANGSEIDGAVGFNTNYSYNFNTNGQTVSGEIDLVSDAELELAHALGMQLGTPMMLFRYSAPGVRELTVNGVVTPSAYFSIDSGKTNLDSYNTTGDSTLWNDATAGNDTFAIPYPYGEEHVFSLTDATELNVLGFNVNASVLEENGIIYGTSSNETLYVTELPTNAAFNGGGPGDNTIIFDGSSNQYSIVRNGALIIVTDTVANRDGSHMLSNVEALRFTDGTVYVPPTIISITTSGAGITSGNGDLDAGKVVELTVDFSEKVTVSGQPVLKLNDGGLANYIKGSGTTALTFTYTVVAGQNTPDLTVTDLDLTGGATIKNAAGNNAVLSGAVINPAGVLQIDTDTGEQAALKLTVNGGSPISAAKATAVPFTLLGLQSDDNGTVSFSDGSHAPVVVNILKGLPAAPTVNLSGLNDGMISATLHLNNDAAGNSFTNVVTAATLDQDKIAEPPTLTAPPALTAAAGRSVKLGIVVGAVDSDDLLSVKISGVPVFESVTAAGATPTVTEQGSTFTYTYTFSALPAADWNNGLILKSSYAGNGHPVNVLTVTVSNTGESATGRAKTISVTDPPADNTIGINGIDQVEMPGLSRDQEIWSAAATRALKPDALASYPPGEIIDNAGIGFGAHSTIGYSTNSDSSGWPPTVSDGMLAQRLALLGQYMAGSFVASSDGHGGTLIGDPLPDQQPLLAHPHA
jgi:hypothetical protein